jgi:hypothetical protein
MTFKFLPQLPRDFSGQSFLISGKESADLENQEFLAIDDNGLEYVLEIRYEVHCSPFKEVCLLDRLLGVGHEDHFYLFDLETNTNLLSLKLDGYFGHLYLNDKLFYVASARGLYCVNDRGKLIWQNVNLGIDGVIIETFENDAISGTGEWDPPNGWRNFRLNKSTGAVIE